MAVRPGIAGKKIEFSSSTRPINPVAGININTLDVSIGGIPAITSGIFQTGFSGDISLPNVSITPAVELSYGTSYSVSIRVEDNVGRVRSRASVFTTVAQTIIDEPLTIDGGTSTIGNTSSSAVVNAEVTISGGGNLTLVGVPTQPIDVNAQISVINGTLTFSGESVTVDAPIIVESNGTIVFEFGADILSNDSLNNITIKPGGTYTSNGRTKTVKPSTILKIRRNR